MTARIIFLLPLFALLSCAPQPSPLPAGPELRVEARPIALNTADPGRTSVGALRYLGGLHLQSTDSRFGGLSGLRWQGGTLYAISDAGDWFAFEPRETGDRLTGVDRFRITHLADTGGVPLRGKADGDAESLNLITDCQAGACALQAYVGFEQKHRIWRYPLKDGLPSGSAEPLAVPADWLGRMPANGGLEAMAGDGGHTLLISEELRTADGKASALWLMPGLGRADTLEERIGIPVAEDFKPTDADYLGPGREGRGQVFLVLFRRYSLMQGVAARLEEVTIAPGMDGRPVATSRLLAELAPPFSVDNMEGLAIRREGDRTFVYIVSDDNFSGAQRSLLMKFELLVQSGATGPK